MFLPGETFSRPADTVRALPYLRPGRFLSIDAAHPGHLQCGAFNRWGMKWEEKVKDMLKQLSVYAENKKGTLENITAILLEKNINILGSMTDDGAEYGVNRMVVSDPCAAEEALSAAGYLCSLKDVIGVEVEDKVGNLNTLLKTLLEMNINVNYLYLSFDRRSGLPIMVFHADDIWEAEDSLRNRGFQTV